MNPRQRVKLLLPGLCCCFCNMGERTWHVRDISKAVSETGPVTISEGPLVMAGQRCSLHIAGQPDCARFWSVLPSRKKASMECGTVLLNDFMERC